MLRVIILIISINLLITGCEKINSTAATEQGLTEKSQKNFLTTQPPVRLKWSLERDNINRRTKLWNSKNKISYIYLLSYGKVMAFYSIQGKVSSVNSQITNPKQGIGNHMDNIHYVLPSPAEDGSYGSNGDAVYFFTADGTYVEWNGEYMLCDSPLTMTTPPALVRTIK